jgi:hypothetical protein
MELMEWLEPSIGNKIKEVIEICEVENQDVYNEFSNTFNYLRQNMPDYLMDELLKLESYFVQKLLVIDTAYRIGFQDGKGLFDRKWTNK